MSFWDAHGIWFILFLFSFPRFTMLMGVLFGFLFPPLGCLFWIGFVLVPRLTVAILATFAYWHTNIILVILTWMWALGGELTEKKVASDCI